MLTDKTEINKILYFFRYYQRDEWVDKLLVQPNHCGEFS
jgi:hypothetical protein